MGLSAKLLPNYSYQDYLHWEGRWELIEGIPFAMSPIPSPKHQRISGRLHSIFLAELDKIGCDCEVYQPLDLKITENTVLNPDLLILCSPVEKNYVDFPPALVVEILSPSTRLKDLNTKFELYQDFGIPYYLIVDPDDDSLKLFLRGEKGKYEEIAIDEGISLEESCQVYPDFRKIW